LLFIPNSVTISRLDNLRIQCISFFLQVKRESSDGVLEYCTSNGTARVQYCTVYSNWGKFMEGLHKFFSDERGGVQYGRFIDPLARRMEGTDCGLMKKKSLETGGKL